MKRTYLVRVLVFALFVSLIAGCSGNTSKSNIPVNSTESASASPPSSNATTTETAVSTSAPSASSSDIKSNEAPYTVTFMYPVIGTMADQDMINAAVNDLATKELNMKVNVIPITFGARDQQLQLMLASGEPLDIFPQNSMNMASYVDSGYVVDLRDYLDVIPNIMKYVGLDDLECCNVGGFIWGVTTMRERANPNGLIMRKDIMDQVGYKIDDLKSLDDVTKMFAAIHEKFPDLVIVGGSGNEAIPTHSDQANSCDPLGDKFGVLPNYGQDLTVVNYYETNEYISLVHYMRDWYLKGYVSKDMSTTQDMGTSLMRAGNLFCYQSQYKPNTVVEHSSLTGYDVVVYKVSEPLCTTTSTNGLGYCISGTSANPAKAVQFLDWAVGSGEFNDTINWGIQGVHWELTDEGTVRYPEGLNSSNVGYHMDWGWAIPNQFAGHVWEGNDPNLLQEYTDFRNNAHRSKAYGFCFDSANVVNEIIACKAVTDQYLIPIDTGSVDPDTELKKFNDALYSAGLQTIMDEKQKQLNAWLAQQ